MTNAVYTAGGLAPNNRTGTVSSGFYHLFCAMVGSGVLAFPKAIAWLGWVAGPLLILVFFAISLLTAQLLTNAYRVNGVEHGRYHHAVNHLLGKPAALWCSIFQCLTLFLVDIAWAITGATTAQNIAQQFVAVSSTAWYNKIWVWALVFGAVELFLSQIRNLEEAWWVSAIGTACSFIYSAVAFVLAAQLAHNRGGTVGGIPAPPVEKTFNVLNSLGMLAFGFSGGQVLLEIQHTLRQPPSPSRQMSKVCYLAITGACLFYVGVGVTSYAAFGNDVDGFVLASFTSPTWAILLANITILIHVATAFQVFAQAIFNTLESHAKCALGGPGAFGAAAPRPSAMGYQRSSIVPLEERLSEQLSAAISARAESTAAPLADPLMRISSRLSAPPSMPMYDLASGLANEEVPLNEDCILAPLWVRLVVRTVYVLVVTLIAAIMPFFSQISGFVGSIIFWPLIVHFPIVLYRKCHVVGREFGLLLDAIYWGMLVVCLAAVVGSCYAIIKGWQTFQFFQ